MAFNACSDNSMHGNFCLSKQQLPRCNFLLICLHKLHYACMILELYGEAQMVNVIPHASAELTATQSGSLEQAVPVNIIDSVCTLHMQHSIY